MREREDERAIGREDEREMKKNGSERSGIKNRRNEEASRRAGDLVTNMS